jgi:hypothetical protein
MENGFNLEDYRLPGDYFVNLKRHPPPHHPRDPFIKGPIPFCWIASACCLPGVGLHVAMAYRFYRGRFQFKRRGTRWGVDDVAKELRVSPKAARRALHAAESAGLLSVSRKPGCKVDVSSLDLSEPKAMRGRRPLFGPIPLTWWHPASQLPGKSLQVAAACWLLAGWYRSAEFELVLDAWPELGLSRQAADRGLENLETARLISVARQPRYSPIVTLLDSPECGRGAVGNAAQATVDASIVNCGAD